MNHQITYEPVSNSPDSEKFQAIQCHGDEHGLAQIVLIPGINDDRWKKLSAKFRLDHGEDHAEEQSAP